MPKTQIPEPMLVELRARGHANVSRFVDPHAVARCSKILDQRGEEWAASVLGRDISRRSIAVPNRPYLTDGELYALNAADGGEDRITLGLPWGAGLI